MKILLTGASGLIGSRFEELMFESHEIIPLSSAQGVDITDKVSLESYLSDKDYDVVIHLAGKTDVDACELDKSTDLELLTVGEDSLLDLDVYSCEAERFKNKTTAVAINAIGTRNLHEIGKSQGKKFVYISSDFVFSGNDEFYTDTSKPSPVDWYGMSKYLGERVVDTNQDLIVRLSFPYGFRSPVKKDLVWKLHDFLKDKEEVSLIADQTITPTFIDDIVLGLVFLLENNSAGVFHLTGSSFLSPREIGEKIKEAFSLATTINSSKLADVYRGKAPRPFQSRMKNDKLYDLGFRPKTLDEALALIKDS